MARCSAIKAQQVLLPDWREALSSTLSEVESNSSSCHESGWSPRAWAKATRLTASLRSSARVLASTITHTLQSPQNVSTRLWVRLQSQQDCTPEFYPPNIQL